MVLEWFNSECPFVKYHYEDKATMVDLANKYSEKGVIWLAVNSTKHLSPEKDSEYAKKYNIPYAILDDRTGETGHSYRATNTPHMFIVNTDGTLAYEGAIDNAPMGKGDGEFVNYVDKALGELTSSKSVSTAKTKAYGCSVKYAN